LRLDLFWPELSGCVCESLLLSDQEAISVSVWLPLTFALVFLRLCSFVVFVVLFLFQVSASSDPRLFACFNHDWVLLRSLRL